MSRLVTPPQLQIRCDGRALPQGFADRLTQVEVYQQACAATRCHLNFIGSPADVQALRLGSVLSISVLGEALFDGRIGTIEQVYSGDGQQQVRIVAHDALQALALRQTRRELIDLSTVAAVKALVDDLGISVLANGSGPRLYRVLQLEQTDLELLVQITRRCGRYFHLAAGRLHLFTLTQAEPALRLTLGVDVLQARVERSASAPPSVQVHAWNPWRGAPVSGTSRAGSSVSASGLSAPRRLVNGTAQSVEQADARAQAEFERLQAAANTLRGVAQGNPQLRPGCCVRIDGIPDGGEHLLMSVTHTVDPNEGYLSQFDSLVPAACEPADGTVATLGRVIQVNDPEALGRVRVQLTCFDRIESDWLEVLLPAAGPDRGLVALPACEDWVLVLLKAGDASQGVVLGGLWGEARPDDAGVIGADTRRMSFRSPGGQRIVLDDKARSVRVEHGNGSFLQLEGDLLTVHAASAMTIEAPGQRLLLRGASIDFEQG